MCGISGYIGKKNISSSKRNLLFSLMKNRGPDSNGYKRINNIIDSTHFFFTRLAILGVKKNSNQPFNFKDKTLIFNGEIYNYIEIREELRMLGYKFYTSSDTEVLIKALDCWGINSVKKLEGMWAFFYYNSTTKVSYLCRDRFGEKPLFYMRKPNEFFFGSEIKYIKCLCEEKLRINYNKLENFLRYGYKTLNKDNKTNYKDIFSVPPGYYLKIKNNKIEKFKYWKIESNIEPLNQIDYFKKLKDQLFKSIEIRLRSDFPIAFFLSGGIDSNALAFIAKKHFNYQLKTYSIIGTDPKYDESKMIGFANKHLGADHTNLSISPKNTNFISNLKEQINYHDSPVATINSLLSFILYKKVKKDKFKVSISGIGSDEMFSGYYDHHLLYFNEIKNQKNLLKASKNSWRKIIKPLIRNPYLKNDNLYIKNPNFRKHIYQHENFKNNIFNLNKENNFTDKKYSTSLMKNRLANEMFNEVVPVVLKEDDLNGMYNSIENRSPFLDKNLFESCFNMPSSYYIQNGLAKWPLRQIIKDYVPDKIRMNARKTGFNASIKDILDFNSKNIKYLTSDNEIFKIVNKDNFQKILNNNKNFTGVENNFLFNFLSVRLFLESSK